MRRLLTLIAAVGLLTGTASAQEVNARAALEAAAKAGSLKTLVYSGAGSSSLIGQQYAVDGGWPTYEVCATRGTGMSRGSSSQC